jgi:hypothetical protein
MNQQAHNEQRAANHTICETKIPEGERKENCNNHPA